MLIFQMLTSQIVSYHVVTSHMLIFQMLTLQMLTFQMLSLQDSIIIGAKFVAVAGAEPYPQCKDAEFNDATIIDDEKLSMHFRNNNSNPESVPPAVKNKKELRKMLEEKVTETAIEQFLSASRLPE